MFQADHIALHVRDLAASRRFYEYLGGRVVSKPSPHFLEVMLGEQRLHLLPQARTEGGAHERAGVDHFCLQVATFGDLAAVVDRLKCCEQIAEQSLVIEDSSMLGDGKDNHCEERPPLKTIYFQDPDGINIEIRAYRQ